MDMSAAANWGARTGVFAVVAMAAAFAGCGGEPQHDSRLIAFVRAPTAKTYSDLYLLQTDGSVRRLTHGGFDTTPVWSPDGERIVFERVSRHGPTLYLANVDGSGQRLLPGSASGSIDWSPDGRHILAADGGRLYVTSGDWSSRTLLLDESPARAEDPRWSPDGQRIAFVLARRGGAADVWAIGADGNDLVRLTHLAPSSGRPTSLAWSPGAGDRIAFLLPRSVRMVSADGSTERVLARFRRGV